MKKHILVVGFGTMGCRHVQSLLQYRETFAVYVVEPSHEIVEANLLRINATADDCIFYDKIDHISTTMDAAIIATSSSPRFEIMKSLLEKGIKLFLLEKIVFQSGNQFEEIFQIMRANNAKAWCNFVNRYFEAYNLLLNHTIKRSNPLKMTVYGGLFGLGCNAIHYIDIFQYLTQDSDVFINDSILHNSKLGNRRGNEYKEFFGSLSVSNAKNDRLVIISDENFSGGVIINIEVDNENYILSEEAQSINYSAKQKLYSDKFSVVPTSKLTSVIMQDIFNANCKLTPIEQTYQAHLQLFKQFNLKLYNVNNPDTICPIT